MPTPVNVILIFAAALAAALLGVWHARRRAARRGGTGPLRSLVILRRSPTEWSVESVRDALARLGAVPSTIDEREDPRAGASFVRVELVDGRRLLFIAVGSAYMADPTAIAMYVSNTPVRTAISTHTAWSSIDLLGGCSDADAAASAMPFLGQLGAALNDGTVLAFHRRDTGAFAVADARTIAALERGDIEAAFGGPRRARPGTVGTLA